MARRRRRRAQGAARSTTRAARARARPSRPTRAAHAAACRAPCPPESPVSHDGRARSLLVLWALRRAPFWCCGRGGGRPFGVVGVAAADAH
eukprot:3444758-Prymnesium_polylepis.1